MIYPSGGYLGLWQRSSAGLQRWWGGGAKLDVRRDGLEILRLLLEDEAVDEFTARGLSAVYASCRNVARTIAALPSSAVRRVRDDRGRWITEPVEPDHWLAKLIDHPNKWQDWPGMVEDWIWHIMLHGKGWGTIQREGIEPSGIEVVHPDRMGVQPEGTGLKLTVKGLDDIERSISWDDIIHVRGDAGGAGPPGLSPLELHRDLFALAQLVRKFSRGTLKRPLPAALLKTKKKIAGREGGTDARKETEDAWRQAFGRSDGRGQVAVLDAGTEFEKIDLSSPADLQLAQLRDGLDIEIARVFRVPPHKIGLEFSGPLRNLEEQNRSWSLDRIIPDVCALERAIRFHLCTPTERSEGLGVAWEVERLVVGDIRTQLEKARVGVQTGWLSPDDVRAAFSMPPIRAGEPTGPGDIYLVLENMQALANVDEVKDDPPPGTPPAPDPPKMENPENGDEETE